MSNMFFLPFLYTRKILNLQRLRLCLLMSYRIDYQNLYVISQMMIGEKVEILFHSTSLDSLLAITDTKQRWIIFSLLILGR